MEFVAAISLASSIFQIVDFSAKLFTRSRDIYQSGNVLPSEAVDIENLATVLSTYLERLAFEENRQLGESDEYLKGLYDRTRTLVQELSSVLDKIKFKSGKTKWKSVKLAMKSIGQHSRIERLGNSFRSLLAEVQVYRMNQASEHESQVIRTTRELQTEMSDIKGLITQYSKNVTDLFALKDERPRILGHTWEYGRQIMVDDGLWDVQPFPLDICSRIEDFMDILNIKFRTGNLPGRKQIELGHIEILNWSETTTLTQNNWSSYAKSGTGIKVSFVVGSGHFLPKKKCARCGKPRDKFSRKGSWRECGSCGLRLREVSPETFPYEAIDISVTPTSYHDFRRRRVPHPKHLSDQDNVGSSRKHNQENTPLSTLESKEIHDVLIDDIGIEFVSRRLTVKWEPLFNIVHRYLYCRCVLRLSTPSRLPEIPEHLIFVSAECPRHNSAGITFQDYGGMVDNGNDPYFDRFGGYDAFRFRVASQPNLRLYQFLGPDFLPEDQLETCREAFRNVNREKFEELVQAWEEYEFEVNNHLDLLGVKLPPDILARLERQRLIKEPVPSELGKFIPNINWENVAFHKEVLQILSGSWNGRPHWAVD